jgi:hypothetical protein
MNPKEMLEHAQKICVERSKNNIINLKTILLDGIRSALVDDPTQSHVWIELYHEWDDFELREAFEMLAHDGYRIIEVVRRGWFSRVFLAQAVMTVLVSGWRTDTDPKGEGPYR